MTMKTKPRKPSKQEIRKAGLSGGLMGHYLSKEACPKCNTLMVCTMTGCDCVCGHIATF